MHRFLLRYQRYRYAMWRLLFVLTGSSWLLAPGLNPRLSYRTTLISFYETTAQPYSWLYRIGDIVAALLLIAGVLYIHRKATRRSQSILALCLVVVGVLMLIDPVATASCHTVGAHCVEQPGLVNSLHDIETGIVVAGIFGLSIYSTVRHKRLPSVLFAGLQVTLGLLLLSGVVVSGNFQTAAQYVYQTATILWIAWFVGVVAVVQAVPIQAGRARSVRRSFAGLAFLAGILAIITALAHQQLFGRLQSVYLGSDSDWLAQHGIIVGVAMLYISRQLARGEYRARIIVLLLLYIEALKYAIVTPRPLLVGVYGLLFVALLGLGIYFRRGSRPLSWQFRIQEAGLTVIGALAGFGISLIILLSNRRGAAAVHQAFGRFDIYTDYYDKIPHHLVRGTLLAHSLTALLAATVVFVLWSLFRPSRISTSDSRSSADDVASLVRRYARSSEDHFKVFPADKQYYWGKSRNSLLAYKINGPVVYLLADPIAPSAAAGRELLRQATTDWRSHGYRVCCFPVESGSLSLYADLQFNHLQIGSGAVIDSAQFVSTTLKSKWWRWQLNRSLKAGYDYQLALAPHSADLIAEAKQVSDAWLSRPGHREQGFALGYFDAEYMQQSDLHLLRDTAGRMVAFANQVPVYSGHRTTVDLMRFVPESQGSMPYLLARTIQSVHQAGRFSLFDLGFVPLAEMEGRVATIAKTIGGRRFGAAGLAQFKNKFEPDWQPIYIAYDGDITDLAAIALNLEAVMKPPVKTAVK